eukprot:2903243-Pleurochrysis_carterae.AAC.1
MARIWRCDRNLRWLRGPYVGFDHTTALRVFILVAVHLAFARCLVWSASRLGQERGSHALALDAV